MNEDYQNLLRTLDGLMWPGCGETVHGKVLDISSTACRQARARVARSLVLATSHGEC